MKSVWEVLNSLESPRLHIIETGNVYTVEIAAWVSEHPESEFVTVDLDFSLQLKAHTALAVQGIAKHARFLTQDHVRYLSERSWLDVAFLNPEDLRGGLEEFTYALSTGAKIIVISDYQTRAAKAVARAKDLGWEFTPSGNMNILRRKS